MSNSSKVPKKLLFKGGYLSALESWERHTFTSMQQAHSIGKSTSQRSLHPSNQVHRPQMSVLPPNPNNLTELSSRADKFYNTIKINQPNYVVDLPQVHRKEINSRLDISNIKVEKTEHNHHILEKNLEFFEKHLLSAHNIRSLYSNFEEVAQAAEEIKSSRLISRYQ
jgi:hypothetical protein